MRERKPRMIRPVAYVESPLKEKFGAPRQSGLAPIPARVVLLPPYDRMEAVRGLEASSHIWLLWDFDLSTEQSADLEEDEAAVPTAAGVEAPAGCRLGMNAAGEKSAGDKSSWSESKGDELPEDAARRSPQASVPLTVRPPRLGGNRRIGVFASRAPYRPNGIGLSSVELIAVRCEHGRPVLEIRGGDMVDGTPVFDIKPYVPASDSHPLARDPLAHAISTCAGQTAADAGLTVDMEQGCTAAEASPHVGRGHAVLEESSHMGHGPAPVSAPPHAPHDPASANASPCAAPSETRDRAAMDAPSPAESDRVRVDMPPALAARLAAAAPVVVRILAQDPRPAYQDDPARVYGMRYDRWEIRFRVRDGVLSVLSVETADPAR